MSRQRTDCDDDDTDPSWVCRMTEWDDYQEWSCEDFSKSPGVKDLNKMKEQYEMFVEHTNSQSVYYVIVTDNIGCTLSFWWRGQGRRSWCFHPRNAQASSRNLDINICWRCYRQKQRNTPIQWACLVHVQGLWCHVLNVWVSTGGLLRDGFTLKGGIDSIRS